MKCLREEQNDCIKIWSMIPLQSFSPDVEFNFSTLPASNVSDERRSRRRLNDHGGISSSRGHNERPS